MSDTTTETTYQDPMPLVKGKSWDSVEKALQLALEHSVSVKGFSHQEFVVAAQNPAGRSQWAHFVKAGHLAPQDIVWAFIPRGMETRTARSGRRYKAPKRDWLGVMVNLSKVRKDTKPFFINLTIEGNGKFLTRLGQRLAMLLEEIDERAAKIERDLMARHEHVDPRFLPQMEEDDVREAV